MYGPIKENRDDLENFETLIFPPLKRYKFRIEKNFSLDASLKIYFSCAQVTRIIQYYFARCDVSRAITRHLTARHWGHLCYRLRNAAENRKSDFLTAISHQPNRTTRFGDEKRDWNRQLISNPETSEVSSSVDTHRTHGCVYTYVGTCKYTYANTHIVVSLSA